MSVACMHTGLNKTSLRHKNRHSSEEWETDDAGAESQLIQVPRRICVELKAVFE